MKIFASRPALLALTASIAAAFTVACSSDSNDGTPAAGTGGSSSGGGDGSGGQGTGGTSGSGGKGSGGASTGGTGTGGAAGGASTLSLHFAAKVGTKAFDCESTYTGLGVNDCTLAPNDFRFYVHDVRLLAGSTETPVALDDDAKWQNGKVALLDFENGKGTCDNGTTDTNAVVKGSAPAGSYTGIAFRIGVPEDQNHLNPATEASPLNLSALQWDWTYGHKFMKIDFTRLGMEDGGMMGRDAGMGGMGMDGGMMAMDGGGMDMPMDPNAVFFHLGSTVCTSADGGVHCSNVNRPELRFETFDPATQAVVVDYAAIVAGISPGHDQGGMPGCMSGTDDPECESMLAAVGLDLSTGAPKTGQTAFSVASQ
ncbi:MAG TPA: MbnP family copper-binding protein [Polyangiaceae bacterium]|nr:MbnP family copper-binding protein [Polyangiaceae bacterium]